MNSNNTTPPDKASSFFKNRDLIIITAILLVAAGIFAFVQLTKQTGATATVTIGLATGSQEILEYPLSKNQIIEITTAKLPVQLEVQDGKIRFINPVCADHNCEGFGWLQNSGEWAACLPAEVVVQISAT